MAAALRALSQDKHAWTVVDGQFGVRVGSSSRDTRLATTVDIKGARDTAVRMF